MFLRLMKQNTFFIFDPMKSIDFVIVISILYGFGLSFFVILRYLSDLRKKNVENCSYMVYSSHFCFLNLLNILIQFEKYIVTSRSRLTPKLGKNTINFHLLRTKSIWHRFCWLKRINALRKTINIIFTSSHKTY